MFLFRMPAGPRCDNCREKRSYKRISILLVPASHVAQSQLNTRFPAVTRVNGDFRFCEFCLLIFYELTGLVPSCHTVTRINELRTKFEDELFELHRREASEYQPDLHPFSGVDWRSAAGYDDASAARVADGAANVATTFQTDYDEMINDDGGDDAASADQLDDEEEEVSEDDNDNAQVTQSSSRSGANCEGIASNDFRFCFLKYLFELQ